MAETTEQLPPPPPETEEDDDDDDDSEETICVECGILFSVPVEWMDQRRKDGRAFYCPNGHQLLFRESDSARLRAAQTELLRVKQRNEQLEAKVRPKMWPFS